MANLNRTVMRDALGKLGGNPDTIRHFVTRARAIAEKKTNPWISPVLITIQILMNVEADVIIYWELLHTRSDFQTAQDLVCRAMDNKRISLYKGTFSCRGENVRLCLGVVYETEVNAADNKLSEETCYDIMEALSFEFHG